MAPRRRGGVVGTVARTAVIAGTATAVSRGVSGAMESSQQRAQQAAYADQVAVENQAQVEAMQQQLADMQAQQAQIAASPQPVPSAGSDLMTQLQQLAQLKEAGMLTDEEFAAAKAKLLAG